MKFFLTKLFALFKFVFRHKTISCLAKNQKASKKPKSVQKIKHFLHFSKQTYTNTSDFLPAEIIREPQTIIYYNDLQNLLSFAKKYANLKNALYLLLTENPAVPNTITIDQQELFQLLRSEFNIAESVNLTF